MMGVRLMWFRWVEFWDSDSEFWWAGFVSMMKMEKAAGQVWTRASRRYTHGAHNTIITQYRIILKEVFQRILRISDLCTSIPIIRLVSSLIPPPIHSTPLRSYTPPSS